jgi:hypothetical protein
MPGLPRLLFSLLIALPMLAETPYTIAPGAGLATGGTRVTLHGDFGFGIYGVIFGDDPATTTTKIDDHTLTAITPPHSPGIVEVWLFEYDIGVPMGLTFEFVGDDPPVTYERVLLPILTPPVHGAWARSSTPSCGLPIRAPAC